MPPNTYILSLSPVHPPKLISPQSKAPPKIPRKPIFRILTLNTHPSRDQAKNLRIKLWKTLSLKAFPQYDESLSIIEPEESFLEPEPRLLSSPSLKKSLKSLKRLELNDPSSQKSIKKLLVQRFRLNKAVISLTIRTKTQRMINKSIHPLIQTLIMKTPSTLKHIYKWQNHIKIIGNFSRIKELYYSYSFLNEIKSLHLKRIRLPALRKLTLQQKHSHGILHVDVLKSFASLEELHLSTTYLNYKTSFQLQSLNLKTLLKLHLYIEGYPYGATRLTFTPLIHCTNLQSLSIHLSGVEGQSLANTINFPMLKELSLKQTALTSLHASEVVTELPPSLENLEKLTLCSSYGPYDVNYYQGFLNQAKNLKHLALEFTLNELNSLTKEPFPSLSLESLDLNIMTTFDSWESTENLAQFIEGQQKLKSLGLTFDRNYSQALDPLVKAIYSLNLEKFRLEVGVSVQDFQAVNWNDFRLMIESLKFVELDMSFYKISSSELSSLMQSLLRNRRLEGLKYNVNLKGISENAFKEFVVFLEMMKRLKTLKVNIKGCPDEKEEELRALMQEKVAFW